MRPSQQLSGFYSLLLTIMGCMEYLWRRLQPHAAVTVLFLVHLYLYGAGKRAAQGCDCCVKQSGPNCAPACPESLGHVRDGPSCVDVTQPTPVCPHLDFMSCCHQFPLLTCNSGTLCFLLLHKKFPAVSCFFDRMLCLLSLRPQSKCLLVPCCVQAVKRVDRCTADIW